jgi:hypothetical protein
MRLFSGIVKMILAIDVANKNIFKKLLQCCQIWNVDSIKQLIKVSYIKIYKAKSSI